MSLSIYDTEPASQSSGTIAMPSSQLTAVALDKSYRKGEHEIRVLQGVDIKIHKGEFLSIVGKSGSGKSTLMHLLGLLDAPDIGEIKLNGERIDDLPAHTKDNLRNRVFGFVFQFYHLLPELSVMENVLAPLMIRYSAWEYWKRRKELKETAKEMIEKVGLSHRLKHKPSELSGGEMQRTAIARALVTRPEILLADEPTGNLDAATGREIVDLLNSLNDSQDLTIVMVTHDDSIAEEARRIVRLAEGRIERMAEAA